jgi:hypothetical protein
MKDERFRTTLAFALGALIVQFLLEPAVNRRWVRRSRQSGYALAMSPYVALLYRAGIATPAPEL